jgi:hypothetical protein
MVNKFNLNDKVHPVYTQSGKASGTIIAMTVSGDEYLKITQGDMNGYSAWNELFGLRWLKQPVYNVIMDEPTRVCTIESWCEFHKLDENAIYNENIIKLYEKFVPFRGGMAFPEEDLANCD